MVKQPSSSRQAADKCRRRRVTFAKGCSDIQVGLKVMWIPSNTSMQDNHSIHCTKKEKRSMRRMARDVADEVYAQDNPHQASIMGRSWATAPDNEASASAYTPIMLRAFESCHSTALSHKELQCLIHWVAYGHSRRGLEKLSVHGLSENMATYRRKAIRTVINMHATAMANHGYLSSDTQHTIADTYRKHSEPATKFAALMGLVDAEAIQEEDRDQRRSTSPTSIIVDSISDCEVDRLDLPRQSSTLAILAL